MEMDGWGKCSSIDLLRSNGRCNIVIISVIKVREGGTSREMIPASTSANCASSYGHGVCQTAGSFVRSVSEGRSALNRFLLLVSLRVFYISERFYCFFNI